MELKSYYDFAENDYNFLKAAYSGNIMANSMGAMAQNVCERYIKHLINEYVEITSENRNKVTNVLSTHNLNKLVRFWNDNSPYKISDDTINEMRDINGFYYSTKYPGDDAETLTEADIVDCMEAIDICKANVDEIIAMYEGER